MSDSFINNIRSASKILLVGPGASTSNYKIDFFQEKRKQGYKILCYTGAINHFKTINFSPDFFSFIDPFTIGKDIEFFENSSLLSPTHLLIADLYENNFDKFYKSSLTCDSLQTNKDRYNRVTSLKFFSSFKGVFAIEMETLFNEIKDVDVDFSSKFFLLRLTKQNIDKFTCFLMPLVLFFFKNLKEIKTIGFGNFDEARLDGSKLGYAEYIESTKKTSPMINKELKKRSINFSCEKESIFSLTLS